MTLRALADKILYRHEMIDKPGVGNVHVFTNRVTLNQEVIVWPDDINPPISVSGHADIIINALRMVMVNAPMLRTYATRLSHEHPITSRYY